MKDVFVSNEEATVSTILKGGNKEHISYFK